MKARCACQHVAWCRVQWPRFRLRCIHAHVQRMSLHGVLCCLYKQLAFCRYAVPAVHDACKRTLDDDCARRLRIPCGGNCLGDCRRRPIHPGDGCRFRRRRGTHRCSCARYARWSRPGCKVPQVNAFLALPHTRLQWGLHIQKLAHCDLAHARANSDRVRSSAAISLSDGGHSGLVDVSTPADPYVLLGCVCKYYKGQAPAARPRRRCNSGSRQSPRGSHSD